MLGWTVSVWEGNRVAERGVEDCLNEGRAGGVSGCSQELAQLVNPLRAYVAHWLHWRSDTVALMVRVRLRPYPAECSS